MQISSTLVGTLTKPFKTKVTKRLSSNYAAAIGETNSLYFDDLAHKLLVAHPVFPVALSWELNANLDKYIETQIEKEIIERLVHQSEHMEINRLLQVGEEVTIKGEIIAVLPHALGTKIVLRFEYIDTDEELILREYTGGIIFGSTCADEGQGKDKLPVTERVELPEGQEPVWKKVITINRNLPYIYDGCANISAQIHTSPKFAKSLGLPDIILHGTATLAIAVKELTTHYELDPRQIILLAAKFTGMVIPGNDITLRVLNEEGANGEKHIDFDVLNSDGEAALKGGRISYRTRRSGSLE